MEGRFSEATVSVVTRAQEEAQRVGSGMVGTEHLLLGLLGGERNRATDALLEAGATLDGCRSKVAELVGPGAAVTARSQLDYTDRARRTLDRADRLALRLRAGPVEPEHVLVSLLDVEGRAGQVLRGVGVDVSTLRRAVPTDAVAGSVTEAPEEPTPLPPAESAPIGPRCPQCGAGLSDGGLAHALVSSTNIKGTARDFVLVYCSRCGAPQAATPVPPRGR